MLILIEFMSFLFINLLIDKVTFIKRFIIYLIFFTELFDTQFMYIFKIIIDNNSRILPIIFGIKTFFIFKIKNLLIKIINLLVIINATIFISKLIKIIFNFDLGRWYFIFIIGLIHFRYYFYLLLYCSYCSITIYTPSLCTYVLYIWVMTIWTFLWIIYVDVDCVHFIRIQTIII